MKIRNKTAIGLILFLCSAVLWGCGYEKEEQSEDPPFTIGVVTKSRSSEYWLTVCSGMEKAAQELGVQLTILYPDTEENAVLQQRMLQDLIKKNVNAIAVSPIDSNHNSYIEEAEKKGIPVYAYDTRILDYDVPYIGIDNRKAGYELAEVLAEKIGGKGKVGIVTGKLDQDSHHQRLEGFRDYIRKHSQIQIAFVETGYSNKKISDKRVKEILEANEDLTGIMATSAVTGLGLMESLEGTGIQIASIDVQEDAIKEVLDGNMAVLAAQDGYEIGYETVKYIMADAEDGLQGEDEILDVAILTGENIEDYKNLKK
ncbi:MAG: substrate-binding domain-containing protein [Eubacteriales bacterium]|nr:substrate-binding domain-containing protein [Eubacteriales bacterium]